MQSNILKGKMVEAGYSQRSLAAAMKMSKNTLSKKINGISTFKSNEIISLCDLLNIVDNDEKARIFLQ